MLTALRALHAAAPAEAALAARALLHLPLPLPGIELRTRLAGTPINLPASPIGAPPSLGVSLAAFIRRVGVEVAEAIEVLTSELRLALVSRSENLGVSAAALMALLHPLEGQYIHPIAACRVA